MASSLGCQPESTLLAMASRIAARPAGGSCADSFSTRLHSAASSWSSLATAGPVRPAGLSRVWVVGPGDVDTAVGRWGVVDEPVEYPRGDGGVPVEPLVHECPP
jgi:hypothetical protein